MLWKLSAQDTLPTPYMGALDAFGLESTISVLLAGGN